MPHRSRQKAPPAGSLSAAVSPNQHNPPDEQIRQQYNSLVNQILYGGNAMAQQKLPAHTTLPPPDLGYPNTERCSNCQALKHIGEGCPVCINIGFCAEPPSDAEFAYACATMPGNATGHIIGIRSWGLDIETTEPLIFSPKILSVRLTSPIRREIAWTPNVPQIAIDLRKNSCAYAQQTFYFASTPGPGIYAMSEEGVRHKSTTLLHIAPIVGAVALWGDMVEHTHGWRARYAYPVHLTVNPYDTQFLGLSRREARVVMKVLGETYGCPAELSTAGALRRLTDLASPSGE